jgi:hypothetical protein
MSTKNFYMSPGDTTGAIAIPVSPSWIMIKFQFMADRLLLINDAATSIWYSFTYSATDPGKEGRLAPAESLWLDVKTGFIYLSGEVGGEAYRLSAWRVL